MYRRIQRFLSTKLFLNLVSLYGVQACTYLLPLITYPYLSRVLRPEGWGAVIFAQTIGAMIAVAVEYGFDFSATREVARAADDKPRLQALVAGVLGAKSVLSLVAVAIALAIRPWTLRVAPSPALFWGSVAWGVAQGINMLWYFQGQQRMTWSGGLDVMGKVVATLSIFFLVRRPEDGWKVMAAQALGCAVAHAVTVITAYREVGFRRPTRALVWDALRVGWPMFLFRASQTLMTTANGLVLGFFATARAVGFFGSADKVRQMSTQALWPISQAMFPHQSQCVRQDLARGARIVRKSFFWVGGLATAFGIVLAVGAPLIIRIAFGAAFLPAVPVLRIFGLVVPLAACAGVLCFQWMLPLGFDREFNKVVLTAGVINVVTGVVLVPLVGVTGMAMSIALAELYAVTGFEWALRRKGMSPFQTFEDPDGGVGPTEAVTQEEEELTAAAAR